MNALLANARADFVAKALRAAADPVRAEAMAAYLKTDMACYGVAKPERVPVRKRMLERYPVSSRAEYVDGIRALWERPHREEKYLAIGLARAYPEYITLSSVPLYRRLVVQGGWWDLVDDVAIRLVGRVLLQQRDRMTPRMVTWIEAPDLWLRRTSIISQIGHKGATDEELLFGACLARMGETEFFIRKAIGWALREYAKTNPVAVRSFVLANRDAMSGLSFREATKHLEV